MYCHMGKDFYLLRSPLVPNSCWFSGLAWLLLSYHFRLSK